MYSAESMSDPEFGARWFTPETCLLCDRKRTQVDPGEFTSRTYFLKSPCWICATCKGSNTYDNSLDEQDERNLANVMSHVLNPRDLFDLSSSIQSSEHNEDSEDVDESFFPLPAPGSNSSSSGSTAEPIIVDDCCNCSSCKTLRELEQMSKDSANTLKKSWDEIKAEVEKLYKEMLIEGKPRHYFRDFCKVRSNIDKLCASDPHLLFRRLEAQVTECVIEAKVRQLTQLTSGPKSKTPAFCLDFVDRLITDFKQLSQAAEQMSDVIKTLEQDHLSLFKMTWAMHNKNQFRVLCWDEPLIRNSLKAMLMGLTEGCSGCPIYPREKYISLYKEYIEFTEEMTVMSVLWGETQRLLDVFQDTQARNEIRARNLTQEIDAFQYDRLLWHQRISQFSDSKAFMSLYTSILAEEADHHEQMLQNLGYKSQPTNSSTGSPTNHEPESEIKTNDGVSQTPSDKSKSSGNCESSIAPEASLAPRKDDPEILNGDVDDDIEPPVDSSIAQVKLSDYLDNIHPPSVPSTDSECSDNDSDSPPKIFERPNLNYLNWTDLLDLPDNYDCFAGYEDSEKEDTEVVGDGSPKKPGSLDNQSSHTQTSRKSDVGDDDDDDSHYHHADQPSTSQSKLSPRNSATVCSKTSKSSEQCTSSEKASGKNQDPQLSGTSEVSTKECREKVAGLPKSMNSGGRKCKNSIIGKQNQVEKGKDARSRHGTAPLMDPIASLDSLFADDNDPCECPVCNSRGRTADELFADDDDDFDFPIKSAWKQRLDGDIDDITERLSKLCPVPSMGPNDMPLPLLSSGNRNTCHSSSGKDASYQKPSYFDPEEERLKGKFIEGSKNKPLAWDTELLTKSLRDYIGQLHARKIATENRIKRENDIPTVLGICTDVVPPSAPKSSKKGSESVKSEEDTKSGDADDEAPTYGQEISAIEFNIYGYEGLEMTKSFRMPIPDVDSTSEVGELESPRSPVAIDSTNSLSPSQKRKKLGRNSSQSSRPDDETNADITAETKTSLNVPDSKCKIAEQEPAASKTKAKGSSQKNASDTKETSTSVNDQKEKASKCLASKQKSTESEQSVDVKVSQSQSQSTASTGKQSGQSNTFKKGFLNSLSSTSKKPNSEVLTNNTSKAATSNIDATKPVAASEGSADGAARETIKKNSVDATTAETSDAAQCTKNAKHRSHIHFSSKQNVSRRMQMSPKTISLTYTAPAKYESPNSNKICAKIDLVPANRPTGLGKMRNTGSPPIPQSKIHHIDPNDLQVENGGHGSSVVTGGCKNTDKCHCFLGSACMPTSRSREDDMREKLRRKLDVKQNVSPKAETTTSQKQPPNSNETGSPAKRASNAVKSTSETNAKKSKDPVLKTTKTSNSSTDEKRETNAESKKSKEPKQNVVKVSENKKPAEKENVDMSKLPVDKLAAYIEGTDHEADKPKKAKKVKKKKQKDNDVSQVAPVPVVQEKPIQHASTSKVSNTTVQAHTAKSTGNHSRSPEVKPNVTKNAKKTVKVPLATEEPKKPRAKKDSFASLGDSEAIFMPRDNLDGLDEGEKELEMFKRFCMDAKPRDEKPRKKICLNVKDIVKKT